MVLFIYIIFNKFEKAKFKTYKSIAKYINDKINPKYQSKNGIYFIIIKHKTKHDNFGHSTYYNIGIKALNAIVHLTDNQEETVVYLDPSGNPITN